MDLLEDMVWILLLILYCSAKTLIIQRSNLYIPNKYILISNRDIYGIITDALANP